LPLEKEAVKFSLGSESKGIVDVNDKVVKKKVVYNRPFLVNSVFELESLTDFVYKYRCFQ